MAESLINKSVHDLRIMAQAFGVTDIFEKDAKELIQEIELKQGNIFSPPPVPIPARSQYDARLMTATPNEITGPVEVAELLEPHIALGLKVRFEHEYWYMQFGRKEDSGTLRMPIRDILSCAERLLK